MEILRRLLLVIIGILFLLSQIFYFDFLFFNNLNNIFLWFACYVGVFIFWILFYLKANIFYIVSIFFLIMGFYFSYGFEHEVNILQFIFYFLFSFFVGLGYKYYFKSNKKISIDIYFQKNIDYYKMIFFLVLFLIIFLLSPVLMYKIFIPFDSSLNWNFAFYNDLLECGIDCLNININFDIILNIIIFLIFLFLNYLILKDKIKNKFIIFIFIILLGFIFKLTVVKLSEHDFKTLEIKVLDSVNNSYYFWAKKIDNIHNLLKDYVKLHQLYYDNAHVGGHPPLPLLFYYFLIKILPDNNEPYLISFFIGILSLFTVIFIYMITKYITKDSKISYMASMFYILTPNSIILSNSGIDSIIVLFISFSLALFLKFLNENKVIYCFLSGVVFGFSSYLSFGVWHLIIVFLLLFILDENKLKIKDFYKFINNITITFAIFLIGIFLVHLLFFISSFGYYNYIESFLAAKKRHVAISRSYEIWSWGNFFHWGQYITPALLSLYFYRIFKVFARQIKIDSFSLVSIVFLIIQFISCTGRAEQQRQWMYLIIFIIPVAVLSLFYNKKGKIITNLNFLNLFYTGVFLWTLLIELFIRDTL